MRRRGEAKRDSDPAVVGGRMKTGLAIRLETEPGKGGAGYIANKALTIACKIAVSQYNVRIILFSNFLPKAK